ncbi:MAG TPA: hypothetical protein VGP08_06810 [Pyrinomonadaceae bacterium]|jgi:hypothetical protein|nr:hypothetical protein [Pyrinomonadaceae bacterium]
MTLPRVTPRVAIGLLFLSLLQVGLPGCSKPKETNISDRLLEASKDAGVQVNPEEVFSISRGAETVAVAPIAGWEQVPATDLRKGTNIGYAYFSTQEPKVPSGYYTLKAFADVDNVGTVAARVQLLDRSGKVAGEIPAEVEVHSLTVPPEAASLRTFVTATDDRVSSQTQNIPGLRPRIWLRCPNGVCFRIPVFAQRRALVLPGH